MFGDFSVLLSVYFKENPYWFRMSLASIFDQTLLPSEIILVEDGVLTRQLYDIIDEYRSAYPIIKVVVNNKNLGLGLSLQKGILACSNDIIARMDTDDLMHSTRFEKQYKCLIENDYDVVSCWTLMFENDITNVIAIKKRPEYHDEIARLAKKRSPVSHPGVMFRKSAVLKAGNYQDVHFYEDYHLWARMIMSGSVFYNIQEPLLYLRTSDAQIERRGGFHYALNEIRIFKYFYDIGFYSLRDLTVNILTHSVIRLLPLTLRKFVLKNIWKRG